VSAWRSNSDTRKIGNRCGVGRSLKHAYFGHALFGLEAASRADFGLGASQLNEQQAARITVLLRAPSRLRDYPAEWESRTTALEARLNASGPTNIVYRGAAFGESLPHRRCRRERLIGG
jgi:membrane carboxypeptidase/penicillin-binding protein PbpC